MIKILVVGLGNMGMSHALAFHSLQSQNPIQLIGLVNRSHIQIPDELIHVPFYHDFQEALNKTKPNLVCIATYPDSHANYAIAAMDSGCHVFVEKPLATNLTDAQKVVAKSKQTGLKLVVGYILRHHPSWQRLVKEARHLGGPYVFRLNLNQQSDEQTWKTHKSLMKSLSPIVDCGVHYVDIMCQITDALPIKVHGIGLRLSNEISEDMYNYGQLQVVFSDSSIGWYEAGWGPMMSETAFFIKDIISPHGAVSITEKKGSSDHIEGHTQIGTLLIHRPKENQLIQMPHEPTHQELCLMEQTYMLQAIQDDLDLTRHLSDAVLSLKVCLAADQSIRTGRVIEF